MASFIYGNEEKTREGILRAVRRGSLKCVGEEYLSQTARKSKLFLAVGINCKADWLLHDTMLHKWRLSVPNAKVLLAYDCDPNVKADGEGEFSNGVRFRIEMDRQTSSLTKTLKRVHKHKEHQDLIFFLTLSQPRIDKVKLRIHDDDVAGRIWFAVWYDLMKSPDHVWQDMDEEKHQVYPRGG